MVTGKSPQKPPTAISPDPRLIAFGAMYGFGAIMIKSKIKNVATRAIVNEAVNRLVTIIPPVLIAVANKFLNMNP